MSADCVEKKKAAAEAEATELVSISTGKPLTLKDAQEKLAQAQGPQYWRSPHELAQTPGFRKLIEEEVPRPPPPPQDLSPRPLIEGAAPRPGLPRTPPPPP